ncbi:MAG: alpha/beta hydrolase [Pseudomonadota bacterium]
MRFSIKNCAGFEIAVREWGAPDGAPVLGVHGLGGQSLNFARLAPRMIEHNEKQRIICPDLIGRGMSAWSREPQTDYCFAQYESIIGDLLDQLSIDRFCWLGVSMGGALGMRMAGGQLRKRVEALVLNDIGPEIDAATLQSIGAAMAADPGFASVEDLAAHLAAAFGAFGMRPSPDWGWTDMALAAARRTDAGRWKMHFDPNVAQQIEYHSADYDLWSAFESIEAPIFVFRGAHSMVLTEKTLADMQRHKPGLQVERVPDVGHAPLLDRVQDATLIATFFDDARANEQI